MKIYFFMPPISVLIYRKFIINFYIVNDGVFLTFVLCHCDVFCSILFYLCIEL